MASSQGIIDLTNDPDNGKDDVLLSIYDVLSEARMLEEVEEDVTSMRGYLRGLDKSYHDVLKAAAITKSKASSPQSAMPNKGSGTCTKHSTKKRLLLFRNSPYRVPYRPPPWNTKPKSKFMFFNDDEERYYYEGIPVPGADVVPLTNEQRALEGVRPHPPYYASTTNSERVQRLRKGDKKMRVREDVRFPDVPLLSHYPRSALDTQQSYVYILDVPEQSSAPLKEQTAVRLYCAEKVVDREIDAFQGCSRRQAEWKTG
ncbi:uncharacterized protein K444DRAFT_629872 [Hyaloscypha bicolor E]|uniref:Uncharacterized protein n=1 Tax=Hyaloscypha bicolor E TaxID=1095630 RepID=A0A2J6TAH3_9HELO|nr:uncharacterized protein K444DRAFT_629872 [Hyaloscypha bicolor E]PMD60030.1 hypothetical protein K444DRAFT_629872 [Hyaloscypha bicolor E]